MPAQKYALIEGQIVPLPEYVMNPDGTLSATNSTFDSANNILQTLVTLGALGLAAYVAVELLKK